MGFWDQLQELVGRGRPATLALRSVDLAGVQPPTTLQAEPTRYGPRRVWTGTSNRNNLKPSHITSALSQADMGRPEALIKLLRQMEDRDAHLVGLLGVRKRAVAQLDLEITPASESERDRDVAAFVEDALSRIDGWERGLVDLMDGVTKGYGAVELAWGHAAGHHYVEELLYRPQEWFVPDQDDPETWRLLSEADPVTGEPLRPATFAIHVARAKSGWPLEAALGRVLLWFWLFKRYALTDWVSYSELFGSPLRVGKFPAGAQSADIDALETALRRLGVDASAVIPANMSVEFVTETGSRTGAETYERLLGWCNRELAKAVLGQTLTTEAQSTGTQALGTVHNDVRLDLLRSDATQLARTLRSAIVGPLVAFNYGPDVPLPRLRLLADPPADEAAEAALQLQRAAVFQAAQAMGLPVPVAQVYEELQVRPPEGAEPVLEAPALPALPFADPAARRPAGAGTLPLTAPVWRPGVLALNTTIPGDLAISYGRGVLEGAGRPAWARLVVSLEEAFLALVQSSPQAAAVDALGRAELAAYVEALADATTGAEVLAEAEAAGSGPRQAPASRPSSDPDGWRALAGDDDDAWRARQRRNQRRAELTTKHATLRSMARLVAASDAEADELVERVRRVARMEETSGRRTDATFEQATVVAVAHGRRVVQERQQARAGVVLYGRYMTRDDEAVRSAHRPLHGLIYPLSHRFWRLFMPPNGWGCRCWREVYTAEEVARHGWPIQDALPITGTGAPLLPDEGWEGDRTVAEPDYDFSAFPAPWREALDARIAAAAPAPEAP